MYPAGVVPEAPSSAPTLSVFRMPPRGHARHEVGFDDKIFHGIEPVCSEAPEAFAVYSKADAGPNPIKRRYRSDSKASSARV